MMRRVYLLVLRLHPAAFRERFGEEMLEIFENAPGLGLLADGVASLFRQWVLRPEFREPIAAVASPLFGTIDPYRPGPTALFQGCFLTAVFLSIVAASIGQGGRARALLIGVHQPRPAVLGVDRDSVEGSDLDTTVRFGDVPEDRWRPIAAAYFRFIRALDAMDLDRDLVISFSETVTASVALRRLDSNRDGSLSAEECGFDGDGSELHLRNFMGGNPVLAALDSDHDGQISAGEIRNSAMALRGLDRNGDGRLTADELIPMRGGGLKPAAN
jgi:hypothetical protein